MLSSMNVFYPSILNEVFNILKPNKIIEIGGLRGEMTQMICTWAKENNCIIQVIEVKPQNQLVDIINKYDFAELLVGPSLEKLQNVEDASLFLIDGDHNYYTVYNELKLIMKKNEPEIIFFHDVGWPWGRRDLYYDTTSIPSEHLMEYSTDPQVGIVPGNSGILQGRGFQSNGNFYFSKKEGGPHNGVLTAIENFMETNSKYTFFKIDCVFGLGVMVHKNIEQFDKIVKLLELYALNPLISIMENDRLASFIERCDQGNHNKNLKNTVAYLKQKVDTLSNSDGQPLYLDLIKKSLLDLIYTPPDSLVKNIITKKKVTIQEASDTGKYLPMRAYTMIGMKRLNNIQYCVENVLRHNVPGDLVETGVWRGGSAIFMRAILKAFNVSDRIVWVADSFKGRPSPNKSKYPLDKNLGLSRMKTQTISQEEVERNFEQYNLRDELVKFLKGWFKDTLPDAPIKQIAVLRLDGDLYESTIDALNALYPKLSPGGYVIIDDYGSIPACKQAVLDYRESHGITEKIQQIDWSAIYWQRHKITDNISIIEQQINSIKKEYDKSYQLTQKEWLFYHQQKIVFGKSSWMGIKCLKNPLDCWVYQEIITEIQPDFIIEIGSFHGGSTLFFAQLLDYLGKGNVISIDIDRSCYDVHHNRIIEITGDSGSSQIVQQVYRLCENKKVLLIHDGDHHQEAVLRDLRLYSDLIHLGSYIIVEDGIVDLFDGFEPHFSGRGPLWATEQFLMESNDFVADQNREKYALTQCPRGYLKRIK